MSSVSVVTGATRGLGLATAQELGRRGHLVVVAGRDENAARTVAEEIRSDGGRAQFVRLDVDSEASAREAAAQVGRWTDRVDVPVNNAGILPEATDGQAHEFASVAMFERTFRTNVFGAVVVTEAFLPLLRRSDAGRIVNVSSTMGSLNEQGNPASPYYQMIVPAYRSSKAALNSVTVKPVQGARRHRHRGHVRMPWFAQTDLTPISREQAPLTAEEAVAPVVIAATLPDDAPSGRFVDTTSTVAW